MLHNEGITMQEDAIAADADMNKHYRFYVIALHWPYYHPRVAIATDTDMNKHCVLYVIALSLRCRRLGAETTWDNIRRASEMTQD